MVKVVPATSVTRISSSSILTRKLAAGAPVALVTTIEVSPALIPPESLIVVWYVLAKFSAMLSGLYLRPPRRLRC